MVPSGAFIPRPLFGERVVRFYAYTSGLEGHECDHVPGVDLPVRLRQKNSNQGHGELFAHKGCESGKFSVPRRFWVYNQFSR